MISRLKFDITKLVNELLDQIPDEIWSSDSTLFLDPAIGGGQFVKEIEKRLKNYGHSDDNISNRVFGYEENRLRVNYAVNKHKLIGTYSIGKTKEMNFDVIVGNPPFKQKNEKGGRHSLWRVVVIDSWQLLKEGGYMAFITPRFDFHASDISDIFVGHKLTHLWTDEYVRPFFNVGSTFSATIVKKQRLDDNDIRETTVPNQNRIINVMNIRSWKDTEIDPELMAIRQKFEAYGKKFGCFECKHDPVSTGYSSNYAKTDQENYAEAPSEKNCYKVRHASKVKYRYGPRMTECHNKRKVMMTFSGYPGFEYSDETNPMSSCYQMSGYILIDDESLSSKEAKIRGENLISLYNTTLYSLMRDLVTAGGMRGIATYSQPKLNLTEEWTNDKLYELNPFGFTQKEIALLRKYDNEKKNN